MKSKITKGNWQIEGETDFIRIVVFKSEDSKSCDGIRQVCQVVQDEFEIQDYEEAEANARVISAAPLMLETLKTLKSQLVDHGGFKEDSVTMTYIDSAIKKAEEGDYV